MITLVPYVLILLAISAVSMYFIGGVIIKQARLLRTPFAQADQYDERTKKILHRFRRVLFVISLTIILMGLIPIIINVLTLFVYTGRPHHVATVSLVYSLGVHLQGLFLSYLVSRLYRLAANEKEMTDYTQQTLEKELAQEKTK